MPVLTVLEAAHDYHISVRTLHNWLAKGWLPAHKILINGKLTWQIESTDLEATIKERNLLQLQVPARTSSHLHEHANETTLVEKVASLEKRVADLENRLDELEQPRAPSTQPVQQRPLSPEFQIRPKPVQRAAASGQLSFYQFAALHGFDRSGNLARWRANHPEYFQDQETHDASGHQIAAILTPEGEHAFYEDFKESRKRKTGIKTFQRCERCPH